MRRLLRMIASEYHAVWRDAVSGRTMYDRTVAAGTILSGYAVVILAVWSGYLILRLP